MTERELLRQQWSEAAAALAIEFVAPFVVSLPDGKQREFAGLLPQFGSERGTIVDTEYEAAAFAVVKASGYACSTMSADMRHVQIDPNDFVDCLTDWGWSRLEAAPDWYALAVRQGKDA
jgi:hypothetical protein